MENPDSESEAKSGIPSVEVDDLEESEATTESEPVNESDEVQHQEQNNESEEQQSEDTSATSDTGMSQLTLVLIGDTNSIEFGSNNILLDHDNQTNVAQFSAKVYDLCGRHISVINLLGVQSNDQIPVNQRIHAFLLLLPDGLHNSHYSSGVQWLEKAFGRESLAYLMTVVTHQTGETCESALNDLKANPGFDERRHHTCRRSMSDEKEIIDLLEKIDVMVSENDPHWYSEVIRSENEEHQEHKEEKTEPSVIQQNQTEQEDHAAEIKNDPVNETSDVEKFKKTDDNTTPGGESEIQPLEPSATGCDSSTGETNEGKEFISESSWNMSGQSMELGDAVEDTSPTSQTVSSDTTERNDQEERAAKTEAKVDPDIECKDAEPSDSNESAIRIDKGTSEEDLSRNKEKQEKVSEEMKKEKNQCQKETEALLGRLHLQDRQQQKLSSAEFLQLRSSVKQQHEVSEKDLPHAFLHRLVMLDYRARYIPVRPDSSEAVHPRLDPVLDTTETDDNDLEAFLSINTDKHQTKTTHVHPMDVQMAVFHCSDNFLKQIMVTKLSQCQYALPLLVPDPFTMEIECPLWTFRHINKTWKVTQIKDDSNIVTMKSIPICKAETPLVSFFRLGSLSVSKSQLMNTLINDRHSTFFHRHCPGSTKSRHLMDGVAEIAWYCPAGKDNDAFSDCIAFCNLHGDALSIEKQRDILMEKSSVNVVLVPTLQQDDKSRSLISGLFKSQKPLICLVEDSCDAVQKIKGKYKMGLKDRSHSDVAEQLRRIIGEVLSSWDPSSSKPTFQLETMAEVSGIRVDESDPVCQRGKSAAMKIVRLLKKMEVSEIKDKFLPCQGHLWHEWSRTNKELYHLKGKLEKERSKKLIHLDQIRQRQRDASCSKLMELFTKSLLSLPSTEKEYFLKWIQILVDALSTDDLSSILQSYDKMWSEVLALKNKKEDRDKNSDELSRKQNELEDISKKLQSATFGLEHIFREMGQIYEAHETMKSESSQTGWSKYPELAADLMISGHPMELMDGDAGHVPLIWISSLLDEVLKKLGDQRVFVLSVLGVQSSGKSTMLNAMFGLQFAVSAGRCTKGAFMQLVKVSEEVKNEKDFRFDYILVVDTEGLRALELAGNATLHHDNELATFVVGLGNMTIVNVFGENPADMQDILQIVVQAFMRMKKVKLSPSCVFVHQNVTDIAATEKNMDGKRRLQEKLDQMAELAAKEETSNAECFSDIIAFDVQKDVKYAAQLWEGSPPMAPPNPGYSESIQEVKNIILSKASTSDGTTLSLLKTKIQDLWNALLNENFVFSFKNTLEIAVYRKLEVQYGNWTWALRSNMLTVEDQLYTRIKNGKLNQIELSYLLKETSKTYEDIKTKMEAHFEDDENKEILVQWKGQFELKIKEFHDEQARRVKRKLEGIIEQKEACKKMDDKKTEFENKLLQKSKELALQLKDEVHDEEELKNQFSSVWDGLVHELTGDAKPVGDINLKDEQLAVLLELGIEWVHIGESKTSGRYKDMSKLGDYSDYVIMKWNQRAMKFVTDLFVSTTEQKQRLSCKKQEQIRELINNVEKESLNEIKSKPVATKGYVSTYLLEVAKNVKEKVTTFQSKYKYTLKNEFTVDLLLHVFDRMESWLLASQKTFKKNNDALTYLDSKKMHYYSIFRSFFQGSSSAVVLGGLICEKLRDSAADAVYNRTAHGLADEMKCNFPAFNGNRRNLEKHLLKSLAENEDFDGFITYITDPRAQAEAFIEEEVENYIFRDHKDKAVNIFKKNVDDIDDIVNQALSDATQKVQGGDTEMWLSEFAGCFSDVLEFEAISSQNFSDINDFKFLQEEVKKGLKPIIEEMKKLSLDKIEESRNKPDEILIDQLCKCCWEKCPFCAAVCTNTIEGHPDDHSVPFHRPSGIKGWHYNDTVEMSINFCTTDVASNGSFYPDPDSETTIPYKQYKSAGPEYAKWSITADNSKLPYWKWFVCKFQKKLEDYHELKFQGEGAIPPEWRSISKEEAIKSLDEM